MTTLFHKDTERNIDALKRGSAHGVLLIGEKGSGTYTAALAIAGDTLIETLTPTDTKGGVDYEKGSIRISQIRAMNDHVKTSSKKLETVILDGADTMGENAQNAFLKLLEEPRLNLRFILTAHSTSHILPTIISRVQKVVLQPLSTEQSQQLIKAHGIDDPRKTQQIMYLANGLPAEIVRLASDEDYFMHQSNVAGDARVFLQGELAEKTVIANRYHTQRAGALLLLTLTQRMLSHSLAQHPSRATILSLDRYANAHEAIAAGGNVRLQLLACVL